MEIEVSGKQQPINFGATGVEEVMQNVITTITTVQGTVPLDRGFGIDIDAIDAPLPIAKARLSSKIIELIQENEPRVIVKSVSFDEESMSGKLIPIVKISIKEGVTL